MDEYKIGDLIEATINVSSIEKVRIRAVYVPDGEDDNLPFRRLVPNASPAEQWFGFHELDDIVRLVAVPAVTREQVIEALTDQPDILASDAAADAVLSLFGQAGGKR
jgi:hypothetical protein